MTAILNASAPVPDIEHDDSKYVLFHSGSGATYRKVAEKPTSFTSIPTINIANIDGTLEQRQAIAREVYQACSECGFFYISNTGVPESAMTGVFDLLKRFFALPHETKMAAHVQKNPAIRGYEPMMETRLDPRTKGDLKEAFTMGDCFLEPEQKYTAKTGLPPPANVTQPQNIWPADAPWWREGLYEYYNIVLPIAMKLVKIIALAFDLEETAFDDMYKWPITGMRPLY